MSRNRSVAISLSSSVCCGAASYANFLGGGVIPVVISVAACIVGLVLLLADRAAPWRGRRGL